MRTQRGFSILEALIAIVISMILLAGVLQIFINAKNTYNVETNFTEIQENSRFAAAYLSRIIRLAGYRTPPTAVENFSDIDIIFPSSAPFIAGTSGTSDTLTVRYQGSGNGTGTPDGTIRDCLNNSIDANAIATNTFSINTNFELQCNGTTLVSNVENMQILFGEDVDGDGSADRYVASNFPSLNMSRVVSIRVALLIRSTDPVDLTPSSITYYLLGQSYTPTANNFLREQITFTIVLRNLITDPI